jgi:hypothetical protein
MYNNYVQQSTNPVNTPYYSMPPSNQPQQRMSPAHHHANQLVKRQTLAQQQQQQQRNSTQMNQQLQLHMSMNVTLPHVKINPIRFRKFHIYSF